jgi:hypothetical protein
MSTPAKRILFVSKLYNGSVHDKKMADEQLKDKAALFKAKELRVDLGFLGIDKQLKDCQVEIPEKKKKKQELTLVIYIAGHYPTLWPSLNSSATVTMAWLQKASR